MPKGLLATLPLPVPALATVSARVVGVKLAVTVVSAESVTVQVPGPEHPPPLQPPKVAFASGVAVSVTVVPASRVVAQAAPQKRPPTVLVTVPSPPPVRASVSVAVRRKNVAATERAALIVTTQGPLVFAHAPDQPTKVLAASLAAVSVTTVPVP